MTDLCKFEQSHRYLDDIGINKVEIIFKDEINKNKIIFNPERIIYIDTVTDYITNKPKNIYKQVYVYKQKYHVNKYDNFPKFHIIKCKVIQDFIDKSKFDKYICSNSTKNDIIDIDTNEIYKDKILNLCGFCKKKILESIPNFELKNTSEYSSKTDIYGYTIDWDEKSKKYKEKQNYTCEKCGLKYKEPNHKMWWHVHHKDGDKTNNNISNLECLCIFCHSKVDIRHEENFSKGSTKRMLDTFLKDYSTKKVK